MPLGDTIVALASPPGRSPRALIRISGPASHPLLTSKCEATPTLQLGAARFHVTDQLSLPILYVIGRGPRTYTGEDSAELLIPGNPALIDRVLAALIREPGIRLATPGEFTARAYLNGKLTLDQAEGVAASVAAQTSEQLTAARDLLSGATGARYHAWSHELATLLALVEAGIDFADQEDVVAIAPADLDRRIHALLSAMEAQHGGPSESRHSLPRIVLAGTPNAGKSTLFNALLGHARTVVSPVAGTTRDAIEEILDLSRDAPGAGQVLLVDLAGLDASSGGAIHNQAQSTAASAIQSADAVLHCDPSGLFPALTTAAPTIRVRTKADLPASTTAAQTIPVCALDGWNLSTLRRTIADVACSTNAATAVLPRHQRALEQTVIHLQEALTQTHASAEMTAGSLRLALDALGELTGRISPDEVIGRIFSTFCIGK